MFRSVSLAALIFSLAFGIFSAAGVAAHSGDDTSVAAGPSAMLSSTIERRLSASRRCCCSSGSR